MKKEKEDTLDHLTLITNRSKGQTVFLFNLVDRNFEKLILIEKKLKNTFTFWVPDDKKTVEKVLLLTDKIQLLNFNFLDCNPVCRHKKYPDLRGIIKRELKLKRCDHCYHTVFKDQWGIFWDKESISNWITLKQEGHPYYWNDKDQIEIIFENKK